MLLCDDNGKQAKLSSQKRGAIWRPSFLCWQMFSLVRRTTKQKSVLKRLGAVFGWGKVYTRGKPGKAILARPGGIGGGCKTIDTREAAVRREIGVE